MEEHSVYEMLAQAYLAKGDKPAAIAELERYVKEGGRNPDALKRLAKLLEDAGNKKEAAAVLDRLNYIYPMDNEAHQQLGALWLDQGNAEGRDPRVLGRAWRTSRSTRRRAHYDLARAYQLDHNDAKAKDELLAALETAPGYRPAQKMLLELNAESGTPHETVKK